MISFLIYGSIAELTCIIHCLFDHVAAGLQGGVYIYNVV